MNIFILMDHNWHIAKKHDLEVVDHKTFFWCIIIRQENGSVRSLITNHMIWSFECLGKKEVRGSNQAKLASIRSRDNWLPPVLKRADGEMDLEGRQSATRRDRQSSSTASSHRGGSWSQLWATFCSERVKVWKHGESCTCWELKLFFLPVYYLLCLLSMTTVYVWTTVERIRL